MAAFKHLLIFLIGVLALATNVFAIKVRYVASFSKGVGIPPGSTARNGVIEDEHADSLLQNISAWSAGRYKGSRNGRTGIITVAAVHLAKTRGAASDELQDMVHLVCLKLKDCGEME